MARKHSTQWLSVAALALLAGGESRGQTQTQAVAPGQVGAPASATQPPAGRTPGRLPQAPSLGGAGLLLGPASPVPVLMPGQAVTLKDALALGLVNEPAFGAVAANARVARLDKAIAKAALLPSAVYHNQFLYTQSSHAPGSAVPQVFIANNSVHEYVSQGQVTESVGFAQFDALALANAGIAIANAELEVARRGLNATITGLYYTASVSAGRIAIEQRAIEEATDFVKQTSQREAAREVSRADVLKAELTLEQRKRDLVEAQLAATTARLDLGVLLYPDPRTPFTVALPQPIPLPDRAVVEAAAKNNNPELASALGSVRSAQIGLTIAKAAYLPSLVLNFSYGIDSPYFAAHTPDGARSLGYSSSATLDIPVFDWFTTAHRVKQAGIQRDLAKTVLSATERRLIANLEQFYAQMKVAHDQLGSLEHTTKDACESLRLTRLRYGAGEATVLEVVDAQNTLIISELAFEDGTVRYQLALANLQTLTGAF